MASEPTETSPAQVASFEYQQAHINDDLRPVLYAVPWALWSLAAIAVCLRFCGKRLVQSPFLLEDVLILVGLLAGSGQATCGSIGAGFGYGLHSISPQVAMIDLAKVSLAFELIYGLAILSIKCSILVFYHRTFLPSFRFRIAVWCVAGFVVCWFVTVIFGVLFQCTPVSFIWNKNQPGHCINFAKFILSTGIINIITDFIIVVMPMPILWNLQLPTTKKIGACVIFFFGGVVVVASILRLTTVENLDTYNLSYEAVWPGVWSVVEPMVGIVGASLPLMAPLFKRIKGMSTKHSTTVNGQAGWYRGRLEEGQRTADVALVTHREGTGSPPPIPKNVIFGPKVEPKGRITREMDFKVEMTERN